MAQAKVIEEGPSKIGAPAGELGESDGDTVVGVRQQISYMQSQGLDHENFGSYF